VEDEVADLDVLDDVVVLAGHVFGLGLRIERAVEWAAVEWAAVEWAAVEWAAVEWAAGPREAMHGL
jgi:ribosomal protein L18E